MKKIIAIVAILTLSACGVVDRQIGALTGKGAEVCQDGVLYLQFTSGVTVKYTREGKVATC